MKRELTAEARALLADLSDPRHGRRYVYSNYGCRCPKCTAANTDYQKQIGESRLARGKRDPSLIPHGTAGGYRNWGCRCDQCTAANNATNKPSITAFRQRQRARAS